MIPNWIATLVALIVRPFGYDVLVLGTVGRRGYDRIDVVRRIVHRDGSVEIGPMTTRLG